MTRNKYMRAALTPNDVRVGKKCFFLEGVAGGGKTWLLRLLCDAIREQGKIVLATAATGIASLLMEKATTAHKRFKIPIVIDKDTYCNIEQGSPHAKLIQKASLIILDEGNMLAGDAFNAMDRTFRDLTHIDAPFGDKTILICGDWRQILAVVKRGNYADTVNATLKRTKMWDKLTKFKLSVNLRVDPRQKEWANTVLHIGNGTEGPFVRLPDEICMPLDTLPRQFIHNIYGDLRNDPSTRTPEHLGKRAILTPLNDTVDDLNAVIVNMLPGESQLFQSCDEYKGNDDDDYAVPTEFLHSLTPAGVPPHDLSLKIGTVVMVTRNLDETNGIQNGTRVLIEHMRTFAIEGIIITEGAFFGQRCILPRIKFTVNDPTVFHFKFTRIQFPVKVAFAMTVHKSEGQTLQNVGIYLPDPVFGHGMLYTGLSRSTTKEGVIVLLGTNQKPPDKPDGMYTANIVFRNVLSDAL